MNSQLIGNRITGFFSVLPHSMELPARAELLNPYADPEVIRVTQAFYNQHYSDQNERIFILGINPGRFGSGITGIAFTDPLRLKNECGIPNTFNEKPELSSVYIYELIAAFGGIEKFYSRFYLNSVCPLGFTLEGKNMNYYDDRALTASLKTFMVESIRAQLDFGLSRKVAICLGEGKNFEYLQKLNAEFHFFETILPTAHPRFIMQYRRKTKDIYIKELAAMLQEISACLISRPELSKR